MNKKFALVFTSPRPSQTHPHLHKHFVQMLRNAMSSKRPDGVDPDGVDGILEDLGDLGAPGWGPDAAGGGPEEGIELTRIGRSLRPSIPDRVLNPVLAFIRHARRSDGGLNLPAQ